MRPAVDPVHEPKPAAAARPASTVILCRPRVDATTGARDFQVLLVKRHGKSGFMAGAHVFPGGRVDDADATEVDPRFAALFDGLDARTATAFVRAAVRETREEAALDVDPMTLRPWSWWITPAEEPKRFDTRFFLAPVPPDAVAVVDEHEAVAFAWLSPKEALHAYAQGEIVLAPPTLVTLEDLVPFGDVDAAAASVQRPLPPICPRMVAGDDGLVLALPGDPLHDVKERAFPQRTRVVMAGTRFVSQAV